MMRPIAGNPASGSKQDQKLFHPKVFKRTTVKDYNSGVYASPNQRQTGVDGADASFILTRTEGDLSWPKSSTPTSDPCSLQQP